MPPREMLTDNSHPQTKDIGTYYAYLQAATRREQKEMREKARRLLMREKERLDDRVASKG